MCKENEAKKCFLSLRVLEAIVRFCVDLGHNGSCRNFAILFKMERKAKGASLAVQRKNQEAFYDRKDHSRAQIGGNG